MQFKKILSIPLVVMGVLATNAYAQQADQHGLMVTLPPTSQLESVVDNPCKDKGNTFPLRAFKTTNGQVTGQQVTVFCVPKNLIKERSFTPGSTLPLTDVDNHSYTVKVKKIEGSNVLLEMPTP